MNRSKCGFRTVEPIQNMYARVIIRRVAHVTRLRGCKMNNDRDALRSLAVIEYSLCPRFYARNNYLEPMVELFSATDSALRCRVTRLN